MDIELIPATEEDLPLMMAWRSNPLIYSGFYTQKKPLTWEEHLAWWNSRNQDWRTFTIEYEGRKVGIITVGQLDHWSPEVGYYIGEISLWGSGVGKQAVRTILKWIRDYGNKKYCHTTVLKKNTRSLKLLKSLGFEILGKARKDESWLTKQL